MSSISHSAINKLIFGVNFPHQYNRDHNVYLPETDRVENYVWLLVGAQQMLIFVFTQLPTQKKNLYLDLVKFPNEGCLLVGVHFSN